VHTQAPDVEGIVAGQGGDTRSEILIVRRRILVILDPGVGLQERSLDLAKSLPGEINISTTGHAVGSNIFCLDKSEGFERAEKNVLPRYRAIDRVMSNLATGL
jgi:hypothetical protein